MAHNFRTKEETARHNRRLRRQFLGALLTVLMVVGLFTVIGHGVQSVSALFDDTKEKQEFEARLQNLVMLDPLPFGTLDRADPVVLKTAALWTSVKMAQEDGTLELYDRDPDDMSLFLPAVDVDKAAAALYGPDYTVQHGTFQEDSVTYLYDDVRKAYKIPPTGQTGMYSPHVESLKKVKGVLRVTVGYIPTYATDEFGLPITSEPEKYMDYLFEKQNGTWYLAAIEESDMKVEKTPASSQAAVASSSSTAQNPQQILEQQTNSQPSSDAQTQTESTTTESTDAATEPPADSVAE